MRYILFSMALLVTSCAPRITQELPLQYSYMPDYLDLDSVGMVLPKSVEEVVDTSFSDFKSIAVYDGFVFTGDDTVPVNSGVVVSPKKAANYVFFEAEYKRLQTELRYAKVLMKEQYKAGLAAEKLYQDEIVKQKKKAERSWLEKNAPYLGFLAGILSAIATEVTVIKLVD